MKDKLIWCNTKEKLAKVIAKLEKDGYTADSVDRMWESYGDKVTVRVRKEFKDITFASRSWYESNNFGTPITADEFLGKSNSPHIVIFRRGRNVIAKDIAAGSEAVAKCSPDDEFNFHTGASIALARLMSKVPATGVLNPDVRAEWTKLLGITETPTKVFTDADRNFKVGDRVVVRDWDDMSKEYDGGKFSLSPNGCVTAFTGDMKHLCGRTATITGTGSEDYVFVEFDDKSGNTNWYFRKWMFNPTDDAPARDNVIREGDTVKVVNIGLNYSSYVQWVGEHISDPYMAARFCFGSPSTDKKYKVIKIAEHESNGRMLAYIEEIDGFSYNSCYLIEVKGLEKA